jgi:anti-sigma B factor antagonist
LLCTMPFQHTAVRLAGDLDVFTRPSLERTLAQVDADVVVIDLRAVTFIDAGALGCLVELKKRLRARDRLGIVRIVTRDARTRRLFHITGLDKIFDLCESLEDAGDGCGLSYYNYWSEKSVRRPTRRFKPLCAPAARRTRSTS